MDSNKLGRLVKIANQINKCKICQEESSGLPVPGEGSPDAKIVFVGEAPGKTEAKTGRPFVGRSGQLLRKLINEAGLEEEDIYITSPVKYLPDRGTPSMSQILHGRQHLISQLEVIKPDVVVLLGRVAVQSVLGEKKSVIKEHGSVIENGGIKYFITVHPAAVLRFAKLKPIMQNDFQKLRKYIIRN